jgi:hypothetical protein
MMVGWPDYTLLINHIMPYLLSGLTIAHIPISYHVPIRIPSQNTKTWLIKSIMWLFFVWINWINPQESQESPFLVSWLVYVGFIRPYSETFSFYSQESPGIAIASPPGSTAQLQAKVRTKGGGSRQHRTHSQKTLVDVVGNCYDE